MAMSGGKDDGEPMMEMNTTPLIDVMLVLLIMFIITIPVATHSVDIDLPSPTNNPPPVDPVMNKIVLTPENQILWNGNRSARASWRPTCRTRSRCRSSRNCSSSRKQKPATTCRPRC